MLFHERYNFCGSLVTATAMKGKTHFQISGRERNDAGDSTEVRVKKNLGTLINAKWPWLKIGLSFNA